MKRSDYVIEDATRAYWPGLAPWRGPATRPGRGYRTREEAERRMYHLACHAARLYGASGGPSLRVIEREHP